MSKNAIFWQHLDVVLDGFGQIPKNPLSPGFVGKKRAQKCDFEAKNRGFFKAKVKKPVF